MTTPFHRKAKAQYCQMEVRCDFWLDRGFFLQENHHTENNIGETKAEVRKKLGKECIFTPY